MVVLSLLVFLPSVNRGVRRTLRKPLESAWTGISKHRQYLWFAGLSLLAMIVFWVFRSRTHFLGDGFNYVANLNSGVETSIWSELLESLLHVQLHKFLNLFLSADGHLTYQVGSVAAGAFFIFLVFLISDYLGRDLFEKVFICVILATAGSVQLFFGYVEHYSYVSLAVLGYILSSLKWMEKGGKIVIPVFLFLLSTAFHFSGFLLLPSLVYLLFLAGPRRITAKKFLVLGGGALLALVLISIYVYTSKPLLIRIFVLPFEGKFTGGYTSFSWAHLLDILNELLLISPAGVILILATLLAASEKADLRSPRIFFLLLVAGFGFVFHFTFDPLLGAARDWDMFAITSPGYTILGICLFLKLGPKVEPLKYASLVLICTSVFSFLPWVALNVSESKAVQRFRDVLELDPKKSKSGHFFLTTYFGKRGMMKEVEKETQRQYEIYPDLYLVTRAVEYYNNGKPDSALEMLRMAQQIDPLSSEVHYYLGKVYHLQGNLDTAEIEYRQAMELKPEHVYAALDLARIYTQQQLWDKALSRYQAVLRFRKDDPDIYYRMGIIHACLNQPDEAVKYFKKAIDMKHDFVSARSGLALTLSKAGRVDDAIEELENAIQFEPDFADAYFQLGYLYRGRGETGKAKASWERFLKLSKDIPKCEVIRNELESLGGF